MTAPMKNEKMIGTEERKAALNTEVAQDLMKVLPEDIQKKIKRAFLSADYDGADAKDVREYFVKFSKITEVISSCPGSPEAFHYLYWKESSSPIDDYYLRSKAGHQIYMRLKAMEEYIPRIIRDYSEKGKPFLVDNFGSGQGYDMINVLYRNPDLKDIVHVRNIDIDGKELERGKKLIDKLGMEKNFDIVNEQIARVNRRSADLIIASGIFCPLPLDVSRVLLRAWRTYAKPGGLILYNATTVEMIKGDPLTDFFMRIDGWPMDYKEVTEIWNLAGEAGWIPVLRFFDEPLEYNCMVLAVKPR